MSKLQPFVERTAVDRSSFRKARAGGIAALLLLATHSWDRVAERILFS